MIAIGGWGDTAGFSEAAATEESRSRFARNVKKMVEVTGQMVRIISINQDR